MEMEGSVMKKATAAILALVVGTVGIAIAGEFIHSATVPVAANVADQVEEGFKRAAERIRPVLPKRVGDATMLTDVSSAGMVLTHHYIVDSDNYDLLPSFMQVVQGETISLICNTEDMKSAMKAGGVYEFNYRDGKFRSLGGFVVTSADCR
jgi:hypothetical protein